MLKQGSKKCFLLCKGPLVTALVHLVAENNCGRHCHWPSEVYRAKQVLQYTAYEGGNIELRIFDRI